LAAKRNLIIYAGQIIRGKGVDVLLESLALVQVPFECFIFGDGNHRSFCQKLARKLGLDGRARSDGAPTRRVHFKGFVPQEDLKCYYREASLAVLSSLWPEPFGAVGLEAMRCGLPVVAFDAGGIGEWLKDGENGFLVPWMDRAGFARRIEQLLLDKTFARRMGERGLQLAAQNYDFSKYVTALEDLFQRVIAEKHSQHEALAESRNAAFTRQGLETSAQPEAPEQPEQPTELLIT
jgi:glycosyltransferase involved in cell wall biosynthesis